MIFDFFEPFRKLKRGLDGYISSRKAFVLVVIGMALLLYIGPNIFRWLVAKSPKILGSTGECIETHMFKFEEDINQYDASISKSSNGNGKGYLFYVGNGKIGLSINDNKMYIYNKRSLSLSLDFHPVLSIDVPGAHFQEGTLIHFTNGIAYKFQCFGLGRVSFSAIHRFFASRSVPSLLIQSIELYNPSSQDVIAHLKKATHSELKSQAVQVKETYNDVLKYKLYSGLVDVRENSDVIAFSVISPDVSDSIIVEAKSSKTITVRTMVHYSDPTPLPPFENTVKKVKEFTQKELQRTMSTPVSDLIKSHINIWKQIWHSGFGISLSKAQGALNGDTINATLYYIMSNTREYMFEWDTSPQYQQVLQKFLYTPDKCYGGHHTLQASKLWSNLQTVRNVNNVVSLWFLTLIKQGCQNLMKAGTSGVMQAMILSFGGFKFSNHHLEFDCEPKDLHRDYYFRRIIYGNSTHINISVILQEDNKAIIYTALDRSDRDYYACDAGCLDTPIKLGAKPAQFPVKITDPLTAILYVTSDKQHMEELKHTIHVKEVVEEVKTGKLIIEGKTKKVFEIIGDPDNVFIESKDRITAGDGVKAHDMAGKAVISTATTSSIFDYLNKVGIKTHFVRGHSEKAFIAKNCAMIPIEWVSRRYATGSFLRRNVGVSEGTRFTPLKLETFFKDDANHDPQWSYEQLIGNKLVIGGVLLGKHEVDIMLKTTACIFEVLEKAWNYLSCSLIDMKVEYGVTPDGEIVLADVIDSDSWRLWPAGDKRLMVDKQVYRNLKQVTAEDLDRVKNNFKWVSDKVKEFVIKPAGRIVVVMGSASDTDHCNKIKKFSSEKLNIPCELRISSAHKSTDESLKIVAEYEGDNVPTVFVAVAGRSNGLGLVMSGNTAFPVINCPPISADWGREDVWSSLRTPSGLGCVTVLSAEGAALHAAQIFALTDHVIWSSLRAQQLYTWISLKNADRKISH